MECYGMEWIEATQPLKIGLHGMFVNKYIEDKI